MFVDNFLFFYAFSFLFLRKCLNNLMFKCHNTYKTFSVDAAMLKFLKCVIYVRTIFKSEEQSTTAVFTKVTSFTMSRCQRSTTQLQNVVSYVLAPVMLCIYHVSERYSPPDLRRAAEARGVANHGVSCREQ
jgi:hypothetical protein